MINYSIVSALEMYLFQHQLQHLTSAIPPPQKMECALTLSFNYWRKSPLPGRAGELCWRSSLRSWCASVISFPLGAAARMVSQAARQLYILHPSVSTSPHTTQSPHRTHALNPAYEIACYGNKPELWNQKSAAR